MMKWIFPILVTLSILFGLMNGRLNQVNSAAISECTRAVELSIALTGSICLWNGMMKVAEKSGLTQKISNLLSPITTRLFHGLSKSSYAIRLITMNITANLLGLGNAATPLGIAAMTELEKETPPDQKGTATDNMVTLVVLNTASIQLIPTTVAVLRLKYGSADPMDIIPAVLISSLISVFIGIGFTKILNHLFPIRKRKGEQK